MRRLLIEPLPDWAECEAWTTPEERAQAEGYAPHRRLEFLGWRALVRRTLGVETQIAYDALGAPVLPHRTEHISVSHCRDRVAVAVSNRRCAVDIDHTDRNYERVAKRYLSDAERSLSAHRHFLAVAWCIKETLYKYAGRPETDWVGDMQIERLTCDGAEERLSGVAHCRIGAERVDVSFAVDEPHARAWIL